MNKRAQDLVDYLDSLTLSVEVATTPLTYIYLTYSLDYTQTLCITLGGGSESAVKLAGSLLLRLKNKQPPTCETRFYADVVRYVLSAMYQISPKESIAIEPVKHCEMLNCSGLVVEYLRDDNSSAIMSMWWNPKVTVYSKGVAVFNDHINWLFLGEED